MLVYVVVGHMIRLTMPLLCIPRRRSGEIKVRSYAVSWRVYFCMKWELDPPSKVITKVIK